MDASPGATAPVGLGVLLVHGMGSAEPGDTLRGVGQPLFDVLRRRPARAAGVQVSDPTQVVLDGGDDEPAHVDFRVWPADRPGEATTWCMAECHWGEAFRPPGPSDVMKWLVLALPFTAIGYFQTKVGHFTSAAATPGSGAAREVRRIRDAVLTVAAFVGAVLLGPVLAALLALVLLLAVPLSRIPVKPLRSPAEAVIRVVSASLGDVYMLASDSFDRRAVDQRLERDLDFLLQRCDRVAIVAHSAGSYLTHCLLNRPQDLRTRDEVPLLVTYGQAVWRVHAVRKLSERGGRRKLAVALSCVALLCWLLAVGLAVTGGSRPGAVVLAVGAFSACLAAFRLVDRVAAVAAQTGLGLAGGRRWRDYVASTDPVPNGVMPKALVNEAGRTEPRSYEGIRIHNSRSVVTDHNRYPQNRDVFLDGVSRDLLWAAGHDVTEFGRRVEAHRAWVARRGRTRWLSTARATFLAGAAWMLTVAGWSDGPPADDRSPAMSVGTWLVRTLPDSWTSALFGLSATGTDTSSRAKIVGLAALAVALYLLWSITRASWRAWDRRVTQRHLGPRSDEPPAEPPADGPPYQRGAFVGLWLAALIALTVWTWWLQLSVPDGISATDWAAQRLDETWFVAVSVLLGVASVIATAYTLWPTRIRLDATVTGDWDADDTTVGTSGGRRELPVVPPAADVLEPRDRPRWEALVSPPEGWLAQEPQAHGVLTGVVRDGDRVVLESTWVAPADPHGAADGRAERAAAAHACVRVAQVLERRDGSFVTTAHYVDGDGLKLPASAGTRLD